MWRSIRRFFVSLNTASILLLLLISLMFLAGFFPQFPRDSVKSPSEAQWWWDAIRERYGPLFPLLKTTGLVSIYNSPLFWGIFLLLLIGATFCSLVRLRRRFHLSRLGSVLAHLGLILLALGLALSALYRHFTDSLPIISGEKFGIGQNIVTVKSVWVKRSADDTPLAFGCEIEHGSRTIKLSPGWPGTVNGFLIIPLSYGPAWKIRASKPAGGITSLTWKGIEREGEIIVPFPALGEVQEITFPEVGAKMEISVQTQGAFVDLYEHGHLTHRLLVQEETKIEGEKIHLQLSPEHYIILRAVKDPGSWLSVAGAVVMSVGFSVALFRPKRAGD